MPTQKEAEAAYDAEIAPALLKVVERCKELGIHMVAHVEWWPGETGITQHVPDGASVQLRMTQLAAHSHGNFDRLGMNMLRNFDCKASMILHRFASSN
ncbi:MAG: hypothetical protein IPK59_23265 [Rhodospirillaceae bacterium]|nr:hypothetical protein [Rhodospirillaceae bacterium]